MTQKQKFSWEEAQRKVREFRNGEVRALTPMAGEMDVLYDDGRYGPNNRNSPPNVELITKANSIWDTRTDDESMSFRSILQKYGLQVLEEVDLRHTRSDAKSKAYVGIPKNQIWPEDDGQWSYEVGDVVAAIDEVPMLGFDEESEVPQSIIKKRLVDDDTGNLHYEVEFDGTQDTLPLLMPQDRLRQGFEKVDEVDNTE